MIADYLAKAKTDNLVCHVALDDKQDLEQVQTAAYTAANILQIAQKSLDQKGIRPQRVDAAKQHCWCLFIPDSNGSVMLSHMTGTNRHVLLSVSLDGIDIDLRCTLDIAWKQPGRRDFAAAMQLFLYVAETILKTGLVEEAEIDLKAHAVRALDKWNADIVSAISPLPWEKGRLMIGYDRPDRMGSLTQPLEINPIALTSIKTSMNCTTIKLCSLRVEVDAKTIDPVQRLRLGARKG